MSDSLPENVTELKELISKILKTPIDNLIHNKDWGKVNFEDAKADLESVYKVCRQLNSLPLEIASSTQIDKTLNVLRKFYNEENDSGVINRILIYDVTQEGHTNIKTDVLNNLKQIDAQLYNETFSYIPFLAYQNGDIQRNIDGLTAAKSKAEGIVDDSLEYANGVKEEVDRIVVATKEAAGAGGVAEFTQDFRNQAVLNHKHSSWWLRTAIGLAVITAGLLFWVAILVAEDPNKSFETISFVTTKLLFFGLLISATVWCAGNYKALKHQAAVNEFKANALQTFRAFVSAANEPEMKDAILMETTQSIFREYKSGHIKEEATGGGIKIGDVSRGVTSFAKVADKK